MSNHYRLNVRFDLNDEAERRAAEYLAELNNEKGKSRNRFIVETVISFMERQNSDRDHDAEHDRRFQYDFHTQRQNGCRNNRQDKMQFQLCRQRLTRRNGK